MNFEYILLTFSQSLSRGGPLEDSRHSQSLDLHPKNLPHFHQHFSNDTRELPRVMSTPNVVRKRKGLTTPVSPKVVDGEERVRCLFWGVDAKQKTHGKKGGWWSKLDEKRQWKLIFASFTIASFISRFWKIWNPAEVVYVVCL